MNLLLSIHFWMVAYSYHSMAATKLSWVIVSVQRYRAEIARVSQVYTQVLRCILSHGWLKSRASNSYNLGWFMWKQIYSLFLMRFLIDISQQDKWLWIMIINNPSEIFLQPKKELGSFPIMLVFPKESWYFHQHFK